MQTTEKMFSNYPDTVDVKQMQEMLHICRSLAYKLLQSNKIVAKKVGRIYRIPKRNIIQYLEEV